MDLITALPPADGHDSILVMVDQGLLKGVILIPCSKTRGLYHAPVIPARIRSFLWNPVDSGGIIFGRAPCQNYHSGDHLFRRNRAIPELGPEWSRNELEWNPAECILFV